MKTIRDVMSDEPVVFPTHATIADAARVMRDKDIADVIVADDGHFVGLLTDRDIVVRTIAEGYDPTEVQVGHAMSKDIATLSPDSTVDELAAMMREGAVRRIPVLEGDRPVGIVSIGDLAIFETQSALADISERPPNT